MKLKFYSIHFVIVLLLFTSFSFPRREITQIASPPLQPAQPLTGAWRQVQSAGQAGVNAIKILSDHYFMVAFYDLNGKKFIGASGGTYTIQDGKYSETLEFHTQDSTRLGSNLTYQLNLKGNQLILSSNGTSKSETWERVDEASPATAPLAGAWRIREREQEGKMVSMPQGPRKTIKILSGSRFQWAAINTETKQFFGTGGGTYTAKDGKYTETIEFFSRDASRVGAKLSFDFSVKNQDWLHSGLSSTGNPIKEIWTRK